MTQSTELTLPEPTTLATMFKAENGLDPLLNKIKSDALAMVKDLNPAVKKDRDLMRSAAFKVSQSKAEIDRRGKELTEAQRKEVAAVNAGRNVAETFLADLRDLVRKPADDWDAKEEARVARCKAAIAAVLDNGMIGEETSAEIRACADRIKAVDIGEWMAEYQPQAEGARDATLATLRIMYSAAKTREDQAAELETLRAEKAAREAAEQLARDQAAEAENARIIAEQAEANRIATEKADAARQAQIEADKLAAAEKAAADAKIAAEAEAARVAQETADRESAWMAADVAQKARHAFELAQAAQAERDRIENERAAVADATAKRAADQAHRARVLAEIADALRTMDRKATPELIAEALMEGRIPHVEVKL